MFVDTVDGKILHQLIWYIKIPLFTGFHTCQVVENGISEPSTTYVLKKKRESWTVGFYVPTLSGSTSKRPTEKMSRHWKLGSMVNGSVGDNANTIGGRNPANQLIGSLSHYLQGFIHPRWCRNFPSTVWSVYKWVKQHIDPNHLQLISPLRIGLFPLHMAVSWLTNGA